eukprot:jgi/Mesen1/9045/ME000057S08467
MNFLRSVLFEEDEENDQAVDEQAVDEEVEELIAGEKVESEELFKDYQQELQDFGIGLKKETEEIVEVTAHKVKDLNLGSGAHVAQVKEAVAMVDEEAQLNAKGKGPQPAYTSSIQRGKYSRYEAQVSAMQRDSSTYCDEPEDEDEYAKWGADFKLDEKKADIDNILKDNAFMQELQSRIVPLIVEYDIFWTRYFYRLHKLQQAEDARADLVKRAATTEEEELSWDVDEDADEVKVASPSQEAAAEPAEGGEGEGEGSSAGPGQTEGNPADAAAAPPASGGADAGPPSEEGLDPKAVEAGEHAEGSAQTGLAALEKGAGEKNREEKEEEEAGPAAAEVAQQEKQAPGEAPLPAVATKPERPSAPAPTPPHLDGHDEGAVSDGSSAGSEWQVVSKDGSPKAPAAIAEGKEADVSSTSDSKPSGQQAAAQEEFEEVESDAVAAPALAAPPPKDKKPSGTERREGKPGSDEAEEDWGEWE